jgi:carbon monoxide dehydrogenase subunit G
VTRNLETRVTIDAPPEAVWAVLADAEAFAEWCDDVQFPEAPCLGERVPMRVRLFGVRLTVKVRFERIDGPRELRWRGGLGGLFVGSHYFRLAPAAGARPSSSMARTSTGWLCPCCPIPEG